MVVLVGPPVLPLAFNEYGAARAMELNISEDQTLPAGRCEFLVLFELLACLCELIKQNPFTIGSSELCSKGSFCTGGETCGA